MKPTLLLTLALIILSSCSHYNYYTISGKNVPKTEENQLIVENDTLSFEYFFREQDGKVGIKIFNKTDDFIEIDWKKSAVILGDKAISYYSPDAVLAGRIENDTFSTQNTSRPFGSPLYIADIKANIIINEPSQFIFPKTHLIKTSSQLPLKNSITGLDTLKRAKGEDVLFAPNEYTKVSYKRVQFTSEKSPLTFRSFLTFRIGKGDNQKEFSQEHQFYISEVWQSSTAPYDFPEGLLKRADRFY